MLKHESLGEIKLTPNARAKRFIVRYRCGVFHLTYPRYASLKEIHSVLDSMEEKLLKLKEKSSAPLFIFTEETEFSTFSFRVVIQKKTLKSIYTVLQNGILYLTFPIETNLKDDAVQLYIKKTIETACRSEAKRIFPLKVKKIADKHGFKFNQIKISKSKSRWGSCSSTKNINLSYFCMMLPEYLIDFIILHELCHTREMNHGKQFWALLDSVSEGKAKELTKELGQIKLKW